MPDPYPKLLVDWLREQDGQPGFALFLDAMRANCESYMTNALQKGETEYEKGIARGIALMIELKDDIINDAEASEDMTEKEDIPKKEIVGEPPTE